jgi:hypothetical protein
MARNAHRDTSVPRRHLLNGPSEGLIAWTVYLQGVVDWFIDARVRARQGEPPERTRRSRVLLGGSVVVVVGMIMERLLIG